MTLRYGIETTVADERPSENAPQVSLRIALVGRMDADATATAGELQRETSAPADAKYGDGSLITQALQIIEHIEQATVIVVPMAFSGSFADLDGTDTTKLITLRSRMLATTSKHLSLIHI